MVKSVYNIGGMPLHYQFDYNNPASSPLQIVEVVQVLKLLTLAQTRINTLKNQLTQAKRVEKQNKLNQQQIKLNQQRANLNQ